MNIGLRIFSVLQTAYLDGLLGGDGGGDGDTKRLGQRPRGAPDRAADRPAARHGGGHGFVLSSGRPSQVRGRRPRRRPKGDAVNGFDVKRGGLARATGLALVLVAVCTAGALAAGPGQSGTLRRPNSRCLARAPRPRGARRCSAKRRAAQGDGIGGVPDEFGTGRRPETPTEEAGGQSQFGRKFKAGALSALLPGAGQYYNGRHKRAYLMAGVEAGIWTAYFVFDHQGDNRMESSREWAGIYAGTDGDHADSYWQSVGRYMDSDAYNDARYREARALQEEVSRPGRARRCLAVGERGPPVRLRAPALRRATAAYDRRDFMILFAVLNRAVSVFDAVLGAGPRRRRGAGQRPRHGCRTAVAAVAAGPGCPLRGLAELLMRACRQAAVNRSAVTLVLAALLAALSGCAAGMRGSTSDAARDEITRGVGSTPVSLEFLTSYENVPRAPYYPLDGIAGCCFGPDGTLIVCDEKRGVVYALDPRDLTWYEFDEPASRPYQPLDAVVDGFKVLVLDQAGASLQRFDPGGAWLDELVDLRQLDPGDSPLATSVDIDRDGRVVVADAVSQQVLLLDSFLSLHLRIGGPGSVATSSATRAASSSCPTAASSWPTAATGACAATAASASSRTWSAATTRSSNPFVAPAGPRHRPLRQRLRGRPGRRPRARARPPAAPAVLGRSRDSACRPRRRCRSTWRSARTGRWR